MADKSKVTASIDSGTKVTIPSFVHKDDEGNFRLYFGVSVEDFDFFFPLPGDPKFDPKAKEVVAACTQRIEAFVHRCVATVELVFSL